MIPAPKGIKKQVFGVVLFSLGAITALLANIIGFELDIFYIAICIVGAGLFLYGATQKNRHKLTNQPASMVKKIPTQGG